MKLHLGAHTLPNISMCPFKSVFPLIYTMVQAISVPSVRKDHSVIKIT